MQLTFYGVRGSTPSFYEDAMQYGGNTASVVLEEAGEEPILFDLGTGLRPLCWLTYGRPVCSPL